MKADTIMEFSCFRDRSPFFIIGRLVSARNVSKRKYHSALLELRRISTRFFKMGAHVLLGPPFPVITLIRNAEALLLESRFGRGD